MEKKPKAIFFDLDGTLVSFDTHEVPQSARQALRRAKEQGTLLFVATGRHRQEMEQIDSLDLSLFSGFVTQNGQYCYAGGRVVHARPIARKAVRQLLEELEKAPAACMFCTGEDLFVNYVDEGVLANHKLICTEVPPVGDMRRVLSEELYQMVIYGGPQRAQPYLARLEGCESTCSNGLAVDVMPAGGGKEQGILKMAQSFGLSREEIMAVGDGDNDRGMLAWAGTSVAMQSGAATARAAAAHHCPAPEEDGIAWALERFVL